MQPKPITSLGGFQGDVCLKIVPCIPEDAKPSNQRIVARGESTGHHHIVEGDVLCYETPTDFYFQVAPEAEAPAILRHIGDEHAPIEIAPGLVFQVPKLSQVEYDGADERQVRD